MYKVLKMAIYFLYSLVVDFHNSQAYKHNSDSDHTLCSQNLVHNYMGLRTICWYTILLDYNRCLIHIRHSMSMLSIWNKLINILKLLFTKFSAYVECMQCEDLQYNHLDIYRLVDGFVYDRMILDHNCQL